MIVLDEKDMQIKCDCGSCRDYARFVITLNLNGPLPLVRLYCAQHTAELLQRAAEALADGECLSDYIDTEHLYKGVAVNG